ncbi:MAG TPA: hypothetical protein VL493_09315 [Candidatus Saccharimonadales bacterium]|jgi:hypothetical protein|nr:hypothetical protein [Candidatus Saccharimonadales bacterium]
MLRYLLKGPWWPMLVLIVVAVAGGWWDTQSAHGVIVDDTTGKPVLPQDVSFGSRHYAVGADGVYDVPNLPRGAKISIIASGYAKADVPADQTEVRLTTSIITTQVNDSVSGKGVPNPHARIGDHEVGSGTPDGSMVIAPAPTKGTAILICAKDYEPTTITSGAPDVTVVLTPLAGADCAPLPTPSPVPTPSGQTPSPSPTASPAASPSASPSP